LEKKKDYKQRADDYHKKEERIKMMRQKASMRNPDEFYFGMHKSKVRDGKHVSDDDYRKLDPELVRVMKSQDLSYVRMQRQKDMKRAERLQVSLQLLDEGGDNDNNTNNATNTVTSTSARTKVSKRKHTVFVETQSEAEEFDVAKHFDTVPELAGRTFNRLRKSDVEKLALAKSSYIVGAGGDGSGEDDDDSEIDEDKSSPLNRQRLMNVKLLQKHARLEKKQAKQLARARAQAYSEMEARKQRAEAMRLAEQHLLTEKLVAGKGRKRKIKAAEDGRPAQYQWSRKRLR
jgi:U3 small nucleolar RNA-associated protein 11